MADEDTSFTEFIRLIRQGDAPAAEAFVRRYEPMIRREVRMRMLDRQLQRMLDSMDICQSVWASFFVRASAGQYDLDNPSQVLQLLITMTRNKLASAARAAHRKRRDIRRDQVNGEVGEVLLDRHATPSREVESRDLYCSFRSCLSEEERRMADLRSTGVSWEEVARSLGGSSNARRMQMTRAVERTLQQLGLEKDDA